MPVTPVKTTRYQAHHNGRFLGEYSTEREASAKVLASILRVAPNSATDELMYRLLDSPEAANLLVSYQASF